MWTLCTLTGCFPSFTVPDPTYNIHSNICNWQIFLIGEKYGLYIHAHRIIHRYVRTIYRSLLRICHSKNSLPRVFKSKSSPVIHFLGHLRTWPSYGGGGGGTAPCYVKKRMWWHQLLWNSPHLQNWPSYGGGGVRPMCIFSNPANILERIVLNCLHHPGHTDEG